MTHRKLFSNILLILSGFFLVQCANPVSPEGGTKDILPPRLVEAKPPNLSTRFADKQIQLSFNEFIHLKDPAGQLSYAPPAISEAEVKVRGKSVIIDLPENLEPNTTYSINFGSAIQDLTENNVFQDFRYVFATGDFIDSLSLKGKVFDAFNLKPVKNVYAMLYMDNNDTIPFDSLPFLVRPYYVAKATEAGDFSFSNLADRPMLLFALNDQNGNFIYDLPNEKIAFIDTLVRGYYIAPPDTAAKDTTTATETNAAADTVTADTAMNDSLYVSGLHPFYIMRMFLEADTVQRVMKTETVNEGQLALYFRNPAKNALIFPLNEADTGFAIPEFSPKRDTLYLWLNKNQDDTLRFRVFENGIVIDTVTFTAFKGRQTSKDKGVKRLAVKSNLSDGYLNQYLSEPVIIFSYPLEKAALESIVLADNKDTVTVKAVFGDSLHRRIIIKHEWKEETSYVLIIPDSTMYSYNGLTNDSVRFSFSTRAARNLGSLVVEATSEKPSGNYIFHLLNEKEAVVGEEQMKKPGKMTFSYLSPGSYKIKVIMDLNSNGKWDPGYYSSRLQPEPVYYFSGSIEIRSNWDVEEKWAF